MQLDWTPPPRCSFAVRYPAGGGTWHYQRIIPYSPYAGAIPVPSPPHPGDLITLWNQTDPQPEGGPVFRVVTRSWAYASYGSADWPRRAEMPLLGPLLDIIVEPASGPYENETPVCAEPGCEAYLMNGSWALPPGAAHDLHIHRAYPPAGEAEQETR